MGKSRIGGSSLLVVLRALHARKTPRAGLLRISYPHVRVSASAPPAPGAGGSTRAQRHS